MNKLHTMSAMTAGLVACLLAWSAEAQGRRIDAATMRMFYPNCVQSPVPADHAFMTVAIHEGDTLANVQVGTKEEASTIVRVSVSPGGSR